MKKQKLMVVWFCQFILLNVNVLYSEIQVIHEQDDRVSYDGMLAAQETDKSDGCFSEDYYTRLVSVSDKYTLFA